MIFMHDQHRIVYYLGTMYCCSTRYPDYGPNILAIKGGIARKYIR